MARPPRAGRRAAGEGAAKAPAGRARREVAEPIPVREWISVDHGQPARLLGFDRTLVCVVVALLALGLVMVYSASVAMPDNPKFARYTPTYFLSRHAMFVAIAVIAALVAVQVPVSFWEKLSPWIFVVALLLLVVVLVPFIGKGVNGARRWIPLGIMSFQPSELTKLAIAMYAAGYMVRRMDVKENFVRAVVPMAISIAVVGLLLLAEPDMGAFLVIATIAMGILFLGGVNGRMFLLISAILVGAFVLMITFSEWRRERIFAYLNPWDEKYTLGKAYQLSHSLIAFGRGEIFGQGLGSSVEKLHYLPEAHTDFLLAVIGEELGFIGVACVIVAFFWLARRLFHIGRQAIALERVFAGLFAQGIGIWVGGQAFINMGVNLGVLPTKGLTLPLMSYGGSAIVMNMIALAIVLRVDIENRQLMRGGGAHDMKQLLVMAAGTGGHVIPGLAVATEMQRRGWQVSWLGTETGLENRLVPPTGIALDRISFTGMRGKGLIGNVRGALRLLGAFFSCSRLIARRRPDAVLGMGGYVCFPGGWMAWLHGKPLLLVNADATLLLSNRALRRPARRIAFGFAGESARELGTKAIVTGNPVRAEIEALAEPALRFAGRAGALRLLVVGGSLGARVLNECVPQAIALLAGEERPRVAHQTGEAGRAGVRAAYDAAGATTPRCCRSSTTWRPGLPSAT